MCWRDANHPSTLLSTRLTTVCSDASSSYDNNALWTTSWTMPPTKKLKQAATKKCLCGQVFANAKAFGRHAVGCINHHSSLSTRVLRYGAVQPHVEPPQQVDMSLSSQRRTILNAPRGSSTFGSSDVMEQQQLDHVAAYNSQLTFMRGETMMPIEDSGGDATATTQQTDGEPNDETMEMEETTSACLEDDNYGSYDNNNDAFMNADENVDEESEQKEDNTDHNNTPKGVTDDHPPIFPIATEFDSAKTIRFKGTVPPAMAAGLRLMDVIGKHSTDLSLYDDIVDFIKSLADSDYNFNVSIPKRAGLRTLCETTFNCRQLKPKLVDVQVKTLSKPYVTMPVFDAQAVLGKMLCSPSLMKPEHIAAGYDIFTGRRTDGRDDEYRYYDEFHTGARWTTAVDHYIKNDNELPCGMIGPRGPRSMEA